MQRDFYRAASELRSTVVSKLDHVQHRKTLRNGKNVLRLKGAEPPAEILGQIGAYFATMGDPYMTLKPLPGQRRPPPKRGYGGLPYDSVFAKEGRTDRGNGHGPQFHNEYVVFNGAQVYSQYVVWCTV